MNTADVLKYTHSLSNMVMRGYLGDLSDADLLERPGEGCNPIAYQIGHLISSNVMLLEAAGANGIPELPDGFADRYSKEAASQDDPESFLTKDEYLALLDKTDAAFIAAIESASPEDLEKPAPEHLANFAPNAGSIYALIATHGMMHAGQWVPVRRRLEKPVVM